MAEMIKRRILVIEDRADYRAKAKTAFAKHADRVEGIFVVDFKTAEPHLKSPMVDGILTDMFFPWQTGSGIIREDLFDAVFSRMFPVGGDLETEMKHCIDVFGAEYALKNATSTVVPGEGIQKVFALARAIGLDRFIAMRGMLPEEIRGAANIDAFEAYQSVKADRESGDENRQACGALTLRLAHVAGITAVLVSAKEGHGGSIEPVLSMLRHEGILFKHHNFSGSKTEEVWLGALNRLLGTLEEKRASQS